MIKDFWSIDINQLYSQLNTSSNGLSQGEAQRRLQENGENVIASKNENSPIKIFLKQFNSPIMLILLFATLISFFTGDMTDGIIILIIIFISATMSFFQEYNASNAVEGLLKKVSVNAEVLRDGQKISIPVKDLVAGDVIILSAGDKIPADCRIIESNNLSVDESTLTGETFPIEKEEGILDSNTELADRSNSLWMGTHIISGSGQALIVNTAKDSQFGQITSSLLKKEDPNNFELGVKDFGLLILRITALMVGLIFLFNIILKKPIYDSFLFALALAVGLTPQMLPAIISVNLSQGAKNMAEKKVIVKKLSSIENFGSMNILCSDKTGTITTGKVELVNVLGIDDSYTEIGHVLAYINSTMQSGYANPIDDAILAFKDIDLTGYEKIDETPYSFITKTLSIEASTPKDSFFSGRTIVSKKEP